MSDKTHRIAFGEQVIVAPPFRRAPAVGLRIAGERGLQRHVRILFAQREHALGKIEVAAARHAAQKVPAAREIEPFEVAGEFFLQQYAALIAFHLIVHIDASRTDLIVRLYCNAQFSTCQSRRSVL